MKATAYERILAAVESNAGTTPRPTAQGVMARCPAHEDRNPSLAITPIEGSVLIHCFAGCATPDVLASLGMKVADLYDNGRDTSYVYTDKNGKPTRRVRRTPTKKFSQSGATKDQPELYRLPYVIEAVKDGRQVYLCEGEKDVLAMEALGVVATTAPMGAGNFSKVDPSPLYGAHVVAVPDQDEPGRRWLLDVCAALVGKVATLRVVQPKVGKDAADHVAAGFGLDQLVPAETPDAAQVLAETTDRTVLLREICRTLQLESIGRETFRIVKTLSDPPYYRFETDVGPVNLGPVMRWATHPTEFSAAFLDRGECPTLPRPGPDRNELLKMIARAAELEDIGPEATRHGETTAWLESYLSERPPQDAMHEYSYNEYPFIAPDGRVALIGSAFRRWLLISYQERISPRDLGRRMREVGAEPDKLNVTKETANRTSRSVWLLPNRSN